MIHRHRCFIGALVTVVLAVTLALSVNSGLATISSSDPRTQGAAVYGPETFGREPGVPADGDLCLLQEKNGCGATESEERSMMRSDKEGAK